MRLIAVSRLAWTRHGYEGTSVTESLQHVPFLNEEANRQGSELADLPRETTNLNNNRTNLGTVTGMNLFCPCFLFTKKDEIIMKRDTRECDR